MLGTWGRKTGLPCRGSAAEIGGSEAAGHCPELAQLLEKLHSWVMSIFYLHSTYSHPPDKLAWDQQYKETE